MPFAYNLFEVLELRNVSVIQMRKVSVIDRELHTQHRENSETNNARNKYKVHLLPFMKPSNQNLPVNNTFRVLVDLFSDDVLNI